MESSVNKLLGVDPDQKPRKIGPRSRTSDHPSITDWRLEREFREPYAIWKADPSPANTGAILRTLEPIIRSAMTSYTGGPPSPNMISKARLMAVKALNGYDPTRSKLRSHLLTQMQSLRRAYAQESQIIGIPEQVMLERARVARATDMLQEKLGREPSDMELARETGVPTKRLAYIRQVQPALAQGSVDRPTDDGEDGGSAPAVLGQSQRDPDVWREFVYRDVGPIDQKIMEYTYGLHGQQSLAPAEIARKLNISQSAISQRKSRIQSLLDQHDELQQIPSQKRYFAPPIDLESGATDGDFPTRPEIPEPGEGAPGTGLDGGEVGLPGRSGTSGLPAAEGVGLFRGPEQSWKAHFGF